MSKYLYLHDHASNVNSVAVVDTELQRVVEFAGEIVDLVDLQNRLQEVIKFNKIKTDFATIECTHWISYDDVSGKSVWEIIEKFDAQLPEVQNE